MVVVAPVLPVPVPEPVPPVPEPVPPLPEPLPPIEPPLVSVPDPPPDPPLPLPAPGVPDPTLATRMPPLLSQALSSRARVEQADRASNLPWDDFRSNANTGILLTCPGAWTRGRRTARRRQDLKAAQCCCWNRALSIEPSSFGSPATLPPRPEALRPGVAAGLPLSGSS